MQKVLPYAVVKRLPRHFFKDVNKEITVDYCQQVKLNYVRDSKTFTNKLSKLADIIASYEELIQTLTDQVRNVNKYYFMNRNEFDEKMAQLQQRTDEALGQLEVA